MITQIFFFGVSTLKNVKTGSLLSEARFFLLVDLRDFFSD